MKDKIKKEIAHVLGCEKEAAVGFMSITLTHLKKDTENLSGDMIPKEKILQTLTMMFADGLPVDKRMLEKAWSGFFAKVRTAANLKEDLTAEGTEARSGVPGLGKEESITGVSRPSDTELLRRAIIGARPAQGYSSRVRWACVMDIMEVGSTTANILCGEVGLDPDETLTAPKCEWEHRGDSWYAACNGEFDIDSYGPAENGYAFCPGCGKEIVVMEGGGE